MATVGDFTPAQTADPIEDPDYFTYFGEEFEIPAAAGAGSFIRFAHAMKKARELGDRGEAAERRALTAEAKERARADQVESNMGAMSAVYHLLESVLGEAQIDRFLQVADRNSVDVEGLLHVVHQLEQAISDRPTRRSSDSSAGPSTTGTPSTDAGSGPTDPATPDEQQPMTPRQVQIARLQGHLVTPEQLAGSQG